MSFPVTAAGIVVFLAAVLCFPRDSGPADVHTSGLMATADELEDSVGSPGPDQLAQYIHAQQQVILINQTLLAGLEEPEPIYPTERSALPANKLEIAAYHADFRAYSAALAAAKINLMALQGVKEWRFAE